MSANSATAASGTGPDTSRRLLADLDTQFHQFPMNARSAPKPIGETHSPDEIPDFNGYRVGLRHHDNQCGSQANPTPRKPNPQQTVVRAQTNTMAVVRTLQDQ